MIFKYEFSPSEQLLRREWLIVTGINCLLLNLIRWWILCFTDPNNPFSPEKIGALAGGSVTFLLFYYFVYLRSGTKYLTFSLVFNALAILALISQRIKGLTGGLNVCILIVDFSIYIWWYVLSIKMRTLNHVIKALRKAHMAAFKSA